MMSFDINDGLYCTMVLSVVNLLDTQDCTSLFLSYKALDLIVTRQGPNTRGIFDLSASALLISYYCVRHCLTPELNGFQFPYQNFKAREEPRP